VTTRPTITRHPLRAHSFEIATMIAFTLVGLALLLDPDGAAARSPVGRALEGWTVTWAVAYVVACPAVLVALWRGSSRLRVLGLILASSGMLMQGTAAVVLNATDPRVFTYYAFAAACALRALVVARYVRRGHP
jgi:uncharacterized membrane protein